MLKPIEQINPVVIDNRNAFLFRPRGTDSRATHFIPVQDWQKLTFHEIINTRRQFEQVLY